MRPRDLCALHARACAGWRATLSETQRWRRACHDVCTSDHSLILLQCWSRCGWGCRRAPGLRRSCASLQSRCVVFGVSYAALSSSAAACLAPLPSGLPPVEQNALPIKRRPSRLRRPLLTRYSSAIILEACYVVVLAGRGAHRALVGAACGAVGSGFHHWRRRRRSVVCEAALIS